jgi:hypothetical protein
MDNLAVSSVKGEVSLTIDLKKLLGLAQESPSINGSNGSFLDQLVSVLSTSMTWFAANITKVKLGVTDAQALSTIDALENTQLQLQVSPTGDVAVTAVRLDQFTLFPKLPPELRMKIWKEACSEPRIVEIDIFTYPVEIRTTGTTAIDYDYRTRTPAPAVLHVYSEARQMGLKHYNRTFRRASFFEAKDVEEQIIYVNFEEDTVYLSLGKEQVERQFWNPLSHALTQQNTLYSGTLCRIKRIAIPMPPRPSVDVFEYWLMLRKCTGLTEVIVECGQDENGFVMMQKASMNQYPSGRKRLRFSEPPSGEKTSCEKFARELRCRFQKNERLPPMITCKRLERI